MPGAVTAAMRVMGTPSSFMSSWGCNQHFAGSVLLERDGLHKALPILVVKDGASLSSC